MFRAQYPRRKPDVLLILYSLVGAALLATLSIHFHLLDRPAAVDQSHSYSNPRG
ncbi:hypothetical protein [Sedimenticola hydrogenitrophicus]|uniref:hypothetical protein n=1 Tax=Sedimenticola hydrogenitrophicus TaxID=2967975 RepID=UPI0021A95BA5|nr:hypothetical protein [Sedimenticola hydrogenitrophicus]